jgi:heptosyltransferase III
MVIHSSKSGLTGDCAITDMTDKGKPGASSILIVSLRYIGDVLVTTPLALSLKTAYPDTAIDYLVFAGTDKAILKNPLVRNIITIPRKGASIRLLLSLFRRYDLAVAAYPSDRTVIVAAVAGKRSIGLIYNERKKWWRRIILSRYSICDDRLHVVSAMLSLARILGVPSMPRAVMGYDGDDVVFASKAISSERYVLLHPYSMKRCKYWPADHWGKLAGLIHAQTGCTAVFTATPVAGDNAYLDEILSFAPRNVVTLPCNLNQFAAALKDCTAYVGIDTAATHIAAAIEAPTIALYGPSLTRYWAPWPNGSEEESPFVANRGVQRKGCVSVIQKDWDCVPCNMETCRISTRDKMECLEAITPEEVLQEIISWLKSR